MTKKRSHPAPLPIQPLPTTPGGFGVVYADPAWPYGNDRTRSAARVHYPVMAIADMMALPLPSVTAADAFCFMWATPPMLPAALRVLAAWGFEFKTIGFWWSKRNPRSNTPFFGMGNYTRANGEPCLLGVRGKPKRASAAISQFVWSPRARHSEKPAVVRERIVELCGDVPRLELFSRHIVPGWTRWGSEVLP